jgi:ankyrin repeat protein
MSASKKDDIEDKLKLLLTKKIDLNIPDNNGLIPLNYGKHVF